MSIAAAQIEHLRVERDYYKGLVERQQAEIARLRALLDRDRLVALLQNEGLGDGGELCSWRCSDKGRYPGPCGCVDALVDLIREETNVSDPSLRGCLDATENDEHS